MGLCAAIFMTYFDRRRLEYAAKKKTIYIPFPLGQILWFYKVLESSKRQKGRGGEGKYYNYNFYYPIFFRDLVANPNKMDFSENMICKYDMIFIMIFIKKNRIDDYFRKYLE